MSSRTKEYPFWLHAEPTGSNIGKLYWGNVRHGEPIPIPESSILRHRRRGIRLHFTPQLSCGDEIILDDTRLSIKGSFIATRVEHLFDWDSRKLYTHVNYETAIAVEAPVEATPAPVVKPALPKTKELILERELSADDGTFGTIKVGDRIFHTAELPDCIPVGKYTVVIRRPSKKFDYAQYLAYRMRKAAKWR